MSPLAYHPFADMLPRLDSKLVVLASTLPRDKMQARVPPQFAHKERHVQCTEEAPDLAGFCSPMLKA